jgi:catechol 2,3-dioxygenase-like lactoylglutathione lyase family enzyme
MEMKLELVPVPVTDVDRAKAFYTEQVGFHADLDERFGESFRVVQLTPPGSACSICIGVGIVQTPPGKPTVSYAYFKDPDGNGWALQQLPY